MSRLRSLRALLAKDLRVVGVGVAVGLPVCIVQSLSFVLWGRGAGYVIYLAAAALALGIAPALVDFRYRTDALLASLPVSRRLLVGSRFLWCALSAASTAVVAICAARLLAIAPLSAGMKETLRSLGTPHLVMFLILATVPLEVFLPFLHRWGLGGGAARFSIALGGLGALAGLAAAAARAAGGRPAWRAGALARVAWTAGGSWVGALASAGVILALGVISFALCVRLGARRDP